MTTVELPIVSRSRRSVREEQERAERRARRRPAAIALATVVTLRAFVLRGMAATTGDHLRFGLEAVGCGFIAAAMFQLGALAGLATIGISCWIMSFRSTA